MSAIDCRDVHWVTGHGSARRLVLGGVSFSADPGEVVGIVGPRGAGKSTLLEVLAGQKQPSDGSVTVLGHSATSRESQRRVGYIGDPPMMPPELSGVEWLSYVASHRAGDPGGRLRLVRLGVEVSGLNGAAAGRIATYSQESIRRLALAAVTVAGSDIVLCDELLTGSESLSACDLRATLVHLSGTGRTVLIASRDLGVLDRVATRVVVLWGGKLAADVRMATLVQERVAELSLRGSALVSVSDLLTRYRYATRTGDGVAIPLLEGLTIEGLLAECRAARVPVAGSRIRYRMLEDILLVAARQYSELS